MLNQIGLLLYTKMFGTHVGSDQFDNQYYSYKNGRNEKRWIVYNGIKDPSKIPVSWFGWLHFMKREPMVNQNDTWIPNSTGTKFAQKSIVSIETMPKQALKCYNSWSPK